MFFLIAWITLQLPQVVDREGLTRSEREHKAAILHELAEPNLPIWAGRYGHSQPECLLAPRAGFICIVQTDLGPIVSIATVQASGNRLALTFEDRPESPVVYWSVPWGVRHYLIPEFRMRDFCALVNAGDEPRDIAHAGWPLVHPADLNRPVTGLPEVPERWGRLFLDSPIRARILRIERRPLASVRRYGRESETRLFLHIGRRAGVEEDLGFFLGSARPVTGFVERVDATSCLVLVREDDEFRADRLRVGDYAGTVRSK